MQVSFIPFATCKSNLLLRSFTEIPRYSAERPYARSRIMMLFTCICSVIERSNSQRAHTSLSAHRSLKMRATKMNNSISLIILIIDLTPTLMLLQLQSRVWIYFLRMGFSKTSYVFTTSERHVWKLVSCIVEGGNCARNGRLGANEWNDGAHGAHVTAVTSKVG